MLYFWLKLPATDVPSSWTRQPGGSFAQEIESANPAQLS